MKSGLMKIIIHNKLFDQKGRDDKMQMKVSQEAAQWYIGEMELEEGDHIQYYPQLYGGIPTTHPNYSLGLSVGKEEGIAVKDVVEGITFYFTDNHAWIMEEYDLHIGFEKGEPTFIFEKK